MQIIGEALAGQYKAKRQDGEYGFEIETEVLDSGFYPPNFLIGNGADDNKGVLAYQTPELSKWKAVSDNSLRNHGIEYIFKRPYIYKTACLALEEFGEKTKEIPFLPNPPGASVHVHINMYNETFLTFGNFVTAYILFENVLQEFAGHHRRSNLFSLPTRVAEPVTWNICQMFEQMEKGETKSILWDEDAVKYGALNFAPMTRLGSLEIRSMRGVTDTETLKTWLGVINSLLIFARTEGLTPRSILSEYRNKGLELFDEVFGEFRIALAMACESPISALIDRNLYYAGCVATSVRDWNTLGDKFVPVVRVEPKTKKGIFEGMINPGNGQAGAYQAAADYLEMAGAGQPANLVMAFDPFEALAVAPQPAAIPPGHLQEPNGAVGFHDDEDEEEYNEEEPDYDEEDPIF